MKTITLVTGNPNKLKEWEALLPKDSDIKFITHKLDLPEIQSLDLCAIVQDKLQRAYDILRVPVVVEDVSAGLDNLQGLPGPFFKFFEKTLGVTALLQLAKQPDEPVTITCTIGYFDGTNSLYSEGVLRGSIVEPRGSVGFGFDPVIVPSGETRTMAEMSLKEKNLISHRGQAVKDMLVKLAQL